MEKEPKLISVLHPSRGRPDMAQAAWDMMIGNMATAIDIEHIVCVDSDDSEAQYYPMDIIMNAGETMVDALNTAFAHSKGQIIVTLFDDITFPAGWDAMLLERYQEGKLYRIGGHPGGLQIVCAGCASVFNEWQYVYYPGYISMYADNDYQDHGEYENRFIDADFAVEHSHPTSGTAEWDETYRRQNSQKAYHLGAKVYKRRIACSFAW